MLHSCSLCGRNSLCCTLTPTLHYFSLSGAQTVYAALPSLCYYTHAVYAAVNYTENFDAKLMSNRPQFILSFILTFVYSFKFIQFLLFVYSL